MTAVCDICQREKVPREHKFDGKSYCREYSKGLIHGQCLRIGYELQRARAEKAERERDEAQEDVRLMQERLAQLTSGYALAAKDRNAQVLIAEERRIERDALRTELAVIRAEAAAQLPGARAVAYRALNHAGTDEGPDIIDAAILHERTVAAAARRPLVDALRYFAEVQDCVCDNSEWESGICCHKQARAALAAA